MQTFNELSEKQDRELVELLKNSSYEAFGELYARFRGPLMFFCKRYLKNEADTEDIVHDIFLQIWETRHVLNTELSFSGYIQTITKNRVFYKFRKTEIHSHFVLNTLANGIIDSTNETENLIMDNDYEFFLNELIERLPTRQKEVFKLSRIEGFTYKEISELLQISIPAVQKHASLALKKIKEHLQQHADIHA